MPSPADNFCYKYLTSSSGTVDMAIDGTTPVAFTHTVPAGLDLHLSRLNFAIVDGNHRFEHVFVDLFFLGRILKPGSLIFLDDMQLLGIKKAVSFFVKNLEWKIEKEAHSSKYHKWAVLRTRPEALERSYDSFTDF